MAAKKSATRRAPSPSAGKRAQKMPKPGPIPDVIFAQASPCSQGGVSMFEAGAQINSSTVANFVSEDDLVTPRRGVASAGAGFESSRSRRTTINIAGTPQTYEQAFNTHDRGRGAARHQARQGPDDATFIECREHASCPA